ncbi:MAG: hypothetical protein JKY65_29685 [Planctomycetes bacterium]|nr:hypothetical protein [Planctomycetota bacterium]
MSLEDLVHRLVEDRSLEALAFLTSSNNDDVYEELVGAAGRVLADEGSDPADDEIVDTIRQRLIEIKATGPLIDALGYDSDPITQEFAMGCLAEIGDMVAFTPLFKILEEGKGELKAIAASQLSLLTNYDFGPDAKKWREWNVRRMKGLAEQEVEDAEENARRLNLRLKGTKVTDPN